MPPQPLSPEVLLLRGKTFDTADLMYRYVPTCPHLSNNLRKGALSENLALSTGALLAPRCSVALRASLTSGRR